jgi:hypothetical protein
MENTKMKPTTIRNVLCINTAVLLAGLALTLLPSRASATTTITLEASTGGHILYFFNINGDPWLADINRDHAGCGWLKLGSGGLDDDYYLYGSSGPDFIFTFDYNSSYSCGGQNWSTAPLNANGRTLSLVGYGGNDYIHLGGTLTAAQSYGSGVNGYNVLDASPLANALLGAEEGSLFTTNGNAPNLVFFGSNYNDKFCFGSAGSERTVFEADGWGGSDTRCGYATHMSTMEVHSCSGC